jgi:O-antigen biosynthesis protein
VLSVAGRGLDAERVSDPRIRLLGWVDDLDALVDRSAVLVAPLRFGAGMKGKIGYAIARGLPVVTTDVGAEGFSRPAGMTVVPGGDWDAFAAQTLALLGDETAWARASADGIELTREEFAPGVVAERFARVLG